MIGERTAEFEYLRVEADAEAGLRYVAHPMAREGTAFALARLAEGLAEFENPEHDFPERIRYERTGADTMQATVEGERGGRPARIEFRFRRTATR